MLVAVTASLVVWGATVATDEGTLRSGAALAGLLVAAVLGVAGCGVAAHAAIRPDRWTRTSVLAAALAFGAGAVLVGWPLILLARIGR